MWCKSCSPIGIDSLRLPVCHTQQAQRVIQIGGGVQLESLPDCSQQFQRLQTRITGKSAGKLEGNAIACSHGASSRQGGKNLVSAVIGFHAEHGTHANLWPGSQLLAEKHGQAAHLFRDARHFGALARRRLKRGGQSLRPGSLFQFGILRNSSPSSALASPFSGSSGRRGVPP